MSREPGHTHLDQARRPRGVCPGCDALWDWQDERVGTIPERRGSKAHDSGERSRRRSLWDLGRRRYGSHR